MPGLEQYQAAHDQGSSHGQSRIIRQAYYEDSAYVPLLLRAYDLWWQLERDAGAALLAITGGIMIGPPSSQVVAGSIRSAQEHDLPHEILDAATFSALRFCIMPTDLIRQRMNDTGIGFAGIEGAWWLLAASRWRCRSRQRMSSRASARRSLRYSTPSPSSTAR